MVASEKRKSRWTKQWADPAFQESLLQEIEAQKNDPYAHSQLPYWLRLELWTKAEGLLILTGIEPGTVTYKSIDSFEEGTAYWYGAQPFHEHPSFSMFPFDPFVGESEFGGNKQAYQSYLEAGEKASATIQRHRAIFESLRHRLLRSVDPLGPPAADNLWRPVAFISWSKRIGFKPDWLTWASERHLLPDDMDPFAKPFFDADSEQYPELLAIAIRAWESARIGSEGTPKQRVDRFLKEKYPHLSLSTREAIALVVNWQKSGGRPAKA